MFDKSSVTFLICSSTCLKLIILKGRHQNISSHNRFFQTYMFMCAVWNVLSSILKVKCSNALKFRLSGLLLLYLCMDFKIIKQQFLPNERKIYFGRFKVSVTFGGQRIKIELVQVFASTITDGF